MDVQWSPNGRISQLRVGKQDKLAAQVATLELGANLVSLFLAKSTRQLSCGRAGVAYNTEEFCFVGQIAPKCCSVGPFWLA